MEKLLGELSKLILYLHFYNIRIDNEFLIFSLFVRYAKVSEAMTRCSIGTELKPIEEPYPYNFGKTLPFLGQIGPLYSFSDALTSEQIKGLYCLGPSYMYSFLGDGLLLDSQNSVYGGILDAKDGLSSKVIFGLNAQVSIIKSYAPIDKGRRCVLKNNAEP